MELILKNKIKMMKKWFYGILVLILLTHCDIEMEEQMDMLSIEEKLIINKWQFKELYIGDSSIRHVGHGFEPADDNSNRWIPFYWFDYNKEKSYEFRSDFRRTVLGFEENYQPYFGYWDVNENELIHNQGLPYEKTYKIIELNDTLFVREYDRLIYNSSDTNKWPIGAIVTYREVFEKRKGPCCEFVED